MIIIEFFFGGPMVDLEMARKLLFDKVKKQDIEEIGLCNALGRVLAYDVEDTSSSDTLNKDVTVNNNYENLANKKQEINKSQKIIEKNIRLRASEIMVIASLGISRIKVYKKPVIAIITIVSYGTNKNEKISNGNGFDINRQFLNARIIELGGITKFYRINDSREELLEVLKIAQKECDLIVSTTATSDMSNDEIRKHTIDNGMEIVFENICINPGATIFSRVVEGKLYLGLPSDPIHCATTFELTVRGIVAKMLSCKEIDINRFYCVLQNDTKDSFKERRFLRARVEEKLKCKVYINETNQNPKEISMMIKSNAILEIKPGVTLSRGDIVEVVR